MKNFPFRTNINAPHSNHTFSTVFARRALSPAHEYLFGIVKQTSTAAVFLLHVEIKRKKTAAATSNCGWDSSGECAEKIRQNEDVEWPLGITIAN